MPYTSLSTTVETTTSGESPGTYYCYWIFSTTFIYLPPFSDLNVAWGQRNGRSFRATTIGWKGALSSNLSLMNYKISVYYIERRCLDRSRISGMRSNYFCHLLLLRFIFKLRFSALPREFTLSRCVIWNDSYSQFLTLLIFLCGF